MHRSSQWHPFPLPSECQLAQLVETLCCTDQQPGEVSPRHPHSCEARDIDIAKTRAQALAAVAQRLTGHRANFSRHQWTETVRVLAMRERRDCVIDFAAMLPLIATFGGDAAVRSFRRSIASIGVWWPSPSTDLAKVLKGSPDVQPRTGGQGRADNNWVVSWL
jgi:hypothetical protein